MKWNITNGTDTANILLHVVNERQRRHRSMIHDEQILKAWGRVLHDEDPAQAIIDRDVVDSFEIRDNEWTTRYSFTKRPTVLNPDVQPNHNSRPSRRARPSPLGLKRPNERKPRSGNDRINKPLDDKEPSRPTESGPSKAPPPKPPTSAGLASGSRRSGSENLASDFSECFLTSWVRRSREGN